MRFYLLKAAWADRGIGILAIASPEIPIFGSITWQKRIGWSLSEISFRAQNEIVTGAGRSIAVSLPLIGEILNMLQISFEVSFVGSKLNLEQSHIQTIILLKELHWQHKNYSVQFTQKIMERNWSPFWPFAKFKLIHSLSLLFHKQFKHVCSIPI